MNPDDPVIAILKLIPWILLALWIGGGAAVSVWQLKTGTGVGRWACKLWGCSYAMGPQCPNCRRDLPPIR